MNAAPHVLIVDDEVLVALAIEDFLGANGYRTSTASNGKTALDLFRRERPSILVTDIRMPIMDGLELARHVRAIDPAVPIVVQSGHYRREDAQISEDERTAFMGKPIDMDALLERLNGLRGTDA